jgi:DNA mismatch repair protein MutS2
MKADGGVDAAAIRALEFETVVREVAGFATCDSGRHAVLALRPRLGERAWAQTEHALVEDTTAFFLAGGGIEFAGTVDVSSSVEQAEKGASLSASDLRQIANAEHKLRIAVRGTELDSRPDGPLRDLARTRRNADDVVALIDRAIDEECRVVDDASPKLAAVRRQHHELSERVRERCRSIIASAQFAKMLSEPIVTIRAGRYVVPVRAEYAPQFPGVVLDQSASGATIFMEPLASVEANNRLRGLEAEEEREVARILAELSGGVARRAPDLVANGLLLARLDSAGARARFALAREGAAPAFSEQPSLRIVRGRHPLLRHEAVPLDFEIGESFDAVVISGPNMGGKTVVLKTVGLLCLLAFAGIPILASAMTTIGDFSRIECIIGDEQSIAQDLSSFSAHLEALKAAVSDADAKTLVLVDEIGSGTEPAAGAALAQACIETLVRAGAKIAVTTHFTQLKTFAAAHDRVRNGSMLFDPDTYAPTYVFASGVPGQSLAFALARSLKLNERLVARAETLLGVDAQNLERTFERLARDRQVLREQQLALEDQRSRSQRAEQGLRQRAVALEEERAAFERRAQAELTKAIEEIRVAVMDEARKRSETAARQAGRKAASDERLLEQTLQQMRRSLGLEMAASDAVSADRFSPGDEVFVKGFEARGTVSEVYDRDLLVTIGNLKTLVAARDVVKRTAAETSHASDRNVVGAHGEPKVALEAITSVDVRGMRVDEAWPLIDKALDNAVLAGLTELRIVHGKGTGRLARGIREALAEHPQVESVAHAADREGGTGVTIAHLR